MISRRNFFIITILMSVIFFLCMFTNNMKDLSNDYTVNAFVTGTAEDYPSKAGIYIPAGLERDTESIENAAEETAEHEDPVLVSRGRVVCIGSEDGKLADTVREWVSFTKRNITVYSSLKSCNEAENDAELPEMLVIDSGYIDWEQEEETDLLLKYVEQGIHLVFSTLPDAAAVKGSGRIQELFGIREVARENTAVEGIHLYDGFLLGGEMVYKAETSEEQKHQDMELTFPWYRLASGTKVYMKGILEDEGADTEDYPVVIWRKSFGTAYVFAVNGGYMEGMTGLGLLSAMSSEMYPYEIYPVVNAQNIVLAGYPSLADENRDVMNEYYERSIQLLYQEAVLPNITTAIQDYEMGLTCLMTPQYDYSDQNLPDSGQLKDYMKNFHEKSVEIGWSCSNVSNISVSEKLSADEKFMTEAVGNYKFASFYAEDLDMEETLAALHSDSLSTVRTVVRDYDENAAGPLGYLSDHITEQRAIVNGPEYSFQTDFRARCVETALGYLNICCDMERIAYPKSRNDSWDELSKEFVNNVDTYGKTFAGFAGTTAAECDIRIRNFLSLDYTESRKGNTVSLQVSGTQGTVWFVFRSYGSDIKEVEGGSFQELEKGVYLIEADSREVQLLLEPADERYYISGD